LIIADHSTLTLLVPRVRANNKNLAAPPHDFAVLANALDARPNLHLSQSSLSKTGSINDKPTLVAT
jgi:hypothetical protein